MTLAHFQVQVQLSYLSTSPLLPLLLTIEMAFLGCPGDGDKTQPAAGFDPPGFWDTAPFSHELKCALYQKVTKYFQEEISLIISEA